MRSTATSDYKRASDDAVLIDRAAAHTAPTLGKTPAEMALYLTTCLAYMHTEGEYAEGMSGDDACQNLSQIIDLARGIMNINPAYREF